MPTIYGTEDSIARTRSTLSTLLNALKTAMASGSISPALAAVYDDHWGTLALVFPSVSIGIEEVGTPWVGPSTGTHRTDFMIKACLRVMIGNSNAFRDEAKLFQLEQSIINYLEERHILTATTPRIVWGGGIECRPLRNFDDTRTIGGELVFSCRCAGEYTSA